MAQLLPDFRPKLEVWNATLDPPYHVFRHRLKQIAQANLAEVAHAVCAPLEAIPRDAVVIPVDDDDWLAPDLADRLAAHYDPAAKGYLWRRAVVEPRPTLRERAWYRLHPPLPSTCKTNDYAVPWRPELAEVIDSHMKAGVYFDAHASRITRIPGTLAIQNRNVSSQTAMAWRRPTITRRQLLGKVRRHRALYDSFELPGELDWARPCMARMRELMGQLRVR